ncbi:uncharacterized protein BCR38DRAFT_407212 [Pseudomassariella vexata]|uniref:Uncharacterized protein n=1 Tax=Pseudomassariella vexata TaxID=1141098 RepID=A0A1Y2E6M7_9PEZI|nr:uncharacterized protein BCR38DRAFT_407212 [Pseudomassariella vexata]ORY67211.1 hypothetical protein BCR38DRAFT_407212 [Pseudomassariella vexata]
MQLSAVLITVLSFTATALPTSSPATVERRDYTFWSTVSDEGFYAAASPPDYYEDQILQFQPSGAKGTASLVAKFPAGFAISQSGAAAIDIYTRTSGGLGTKIGTAGPLPVSGGKITTAVNTVIANFAATSDLVFEFRIASETENGSLQFFETADAGFFVRTETA